MITAPADVLRRSTPSDIVSSESRVSDKAAPTGGLGASQRVSSPLWQRIAVSILQRQTSSVQFMNCSIPSRRQISFECGPPRSIPIRIDGATIMAEALQFPFQFRPEGHREICEAAAKPSLEYAIASEGAAE